MIEIIRALEASPEALRTRQQALSESAGRAAAEIIARVRAEGDRAVLELTEKFDGARLSQLEVTQAEFDEAEAQTDPALKQLLREAAENIRAFHSRQCAPGFMLADRPGVVLGQMIRPLERVGLYVPGGTASYPSSVLMNAIPALLAGVDERVMVTPPGKDGKIPPALLTAGRIAGVSRAFKCGGAQAVAALAYGTESIPRVDKIVGPGNAYVAAAKRQVYGLVDIDMIAGPSEVLVIAEDPKDAAFIACDMLAQAEHDALAAAILITPSEKLALAVRARLEEELSRMPRGEIARKSIDDNGRIVLVETLQEAVRLSNLIAPEHLELCLDEPFLLLGAVKNAGSVFLGRHAPEALGDYWAGPNHTLPTGGAARFSSPLSVEDFVKKTQYIAYDRAALAGAKEQVVRLAQAEGLYAHARSVAVRFEEEP
ncbi:MAG: histidinol dehydrogenase [Candidatus Limiplasma sp.]|nr:histidinol dehydrogenase [Candidatus Limiplasma sp.]